MNWERLELDRQIVLAKSKSEDFNGLLFIYIMEWETWVYLKDYLEYLPTSFGRSDFERSKTTLEILGFLQPKN